MTHHAAAPAAGAPTRVCTECCEEKPIEAFAKGANGPKSYCKACDANRSRERYWRDVERTRARRRELRAEDAKRHREQARQRYWSDPEKHRASGRARAATERGRQLNQSAVAKYKAAHPIAAAARRAAQRAERRGELKRPEQCSAVACAGPAHHQHHADYRRPLDVVFLCRLHHEHAHHLGPVPLIDGTIATAPREVP